jgi:tetratricopeptide (TPR) repeat protein
MSDLQNAGDERKTLDSWKAISLYLHREIRTVQRWEKSEHLPIRRHFHQKQGSVYAYTDELDNWIAQRQRRPAAPAAENTSSRSGGARRLLSSSGSRLRSFVGRRTERQRLIEAFDSALSGEGRIVGISGEAGLGKTSIVDHFLEQIDSGSVWIARGNCSERLGAADPYHPLIEALENILHSDDTGAARQLLETLAPAWRREVAAPVTGSERAGERPHDRMHRQLAHFLQDLSAQKPVILILDDLHWADVSTVDAIRAMSSRLARWHLLLIVCYRPDEPAAAGRSTLPPILEFRPREVYCEIELSRLAVEDVAQYIEIEFPRHAFGTDFSNFIKAQSGGNPLFMVELLRYLRERGAIAARDGRWMLTERPDRAAWDMPQSVRTAIQRKMERLTPEDQSLLKAASVQGGEFESAILADVLGISLEAVEERLYDLAHRHSLVTLIGEGEMPDGGFTLRYRFMHVLYQNMLWDSIRGARRVRSAGRTAGAMVRIYGNRRVLRAADIALLFETARNYSQAVQYYLIAAKEALRVFANQEVITLCRKAARLLKKVTDESVRSEYELEMQLVLRIPLTTVAGYGCEDLQEIFHRTRRLSRHVEDDSKLIPVLWSEYLYDVVRGKLDAAWRRASELHRQGVQRRDRDILAHSHQAFLSILSHRGAPDKAWGHFEKGLSCYDSARSAFHVENFGRDPGVGLLCMGSLVAWVRGYPDKAVELTARATDLARATNHPHSLALALTFCSWIRWLRRELVYTADWIHEIEILASRHDLHTIMGWLAIVKAARLVSMNAPEQAAEAMRGGLARYWTDGMVLHRPVAVGLFASLLLMNGQSAEALGAIEEAIRIARSTEQGHYLAELYRIKGEILWKNGGNENRVSAEKTLQMAFRLAQRQGARSFQLRTAVSLRRFYEESERSGGLTSLRKTYRLFTEGFDVPDLVDARALLGGH